MAGDELKLKFNSPTKDSRTPDILVQPVYGTIYTTSTKKNAEHGGFSFGDTNVGLIVSNPDLRPRGQDAGRHLTGSADYPQGARARPRAAQFRTEGGTEILPLLSQRPRGRQQLAGIPLQIKPKRVPADVQAPFLTP